MRRRRHISRVESSVALDLPVAGNNPAVPMGIAENVTPSSEKLQSISIDLGGGRIGLSGIYRQQQTSYDVHRIRFYVQEDGYGYKITDLLANYVVGANGILVDFGDEDVNEMWMEHQFDPNEPDAEFASIQRFMVMTLVRDGESMYQIVADKDDFYVVPIDCLDLPLNALAQGSTVAAHFQYNIGFSHPYYSGIDRDSMWRPIRHNFRPIYSGDPFSLAAENVIHSFVRKYAGQERGLSWFLGALDTMADLNAFEQNVAKAVKNAASDPGYYKVAARWYPSINVDDVTSVNTARSVLSREVHRDPSERGILPHDIEFMPSNIGNVFQSGVTDVYRRAALSRIAACVGLSYNAVAGDFAAANFSSAQQGSLDNRALYRTTQSKILSAVKKIVCRWMEWQMVRSSAMERKLRNVKPQYILPPFEYIDRAKAAQADAALLDMGATARSVLILANGQDPDAIFRQRAEDEDKMRKYCEEFDIPYPGPPRPSEQEEMMQQQIEAGMMPGQQPNGSPQESNDSQGETDKDA